jgi:hypothetical protein
MIRSPRSVPGGRPAAASTPGWRPPSSDERPRGPFSPRSPRPAIPRFRSPPNPKEISQHQLFL